MIYNRDAGSKNTKSSGHSTKRSVSFLARMRISASGLGKKTHALLHSLVELDHPEFVAVVHYESDENDLDF